MGFVHFNHKRYLVDRNGNPFYLVGINYTAGYVCTNFWKDWRSDSILRDLDQIADLDLNGIRIPVHWDTFEPCEGVYSKEMFDRLEWFLDRCLERGIYVMPWCLVGIATEEYDVCWRSGRSFFFDESMVRAAENHLAHLAKRFYNHEGLLCWDICDEPEWYSRFPNADPLPYPTDLFTQWVNRMAKALKSYDKNHMVTLGFGHIATGRFGMDLRECANALDFMAVTAYASARIEPLCTPRPGYELLYHLDMNKRYRPTFLCECPGWSQGEASEETIAHLYNTTCYSAWLHGSCGVLPWVFSFYDEQLIMQDRSKCLDIHPIEPWFGIVNEKRVLLQNGRALSEFGKTMRDICATDYYMRNPQCALIVPRGYHTALQRDIERKMITVHAALCGADIPTDMVWWDELDSVRYPLAILSLTAGMTSTDWRMLSEYTYAGGTLLLLGIEGSIFFHRMLGAWLDGRELTRLSTEMRFEVAIGNIAPGSVMDLSAGLKNLRQRVKMDDGQTVACQQDGVPVIIRHKWGKGMAYAVLTDIVSCLADQTTAEWRQSNIFAFFNAVADDAGVNQPSRCEDPGVETGVLCSKVDAILVAVNHNPCDVVATVELRDCAWRLGRPYSEDKTIRLPLAAGEAKIIRLEKNDRH